MQYSDLRVPVGFSSPDTIMRSIQFCINGAYTPITLGLQQAGFYISPFAGTITGVTLIANTTGSIQMDIWKCATGSVPTETDSITAFDPPQLVSAQQSTNTTLTGWTTAVSVGDVFAICVLESDGISSVSMSLAIQES